MGPPDASIANGSDQDTGTRESSISVEMLKSDGQLYTTGGNVSSIMGDIVSSVTYNRRK